MLGSFLKKFSNLFSRIATKDVDEEFIAIHVSSSSNQTHGLHNSHISYFLIHYIHLFTIVHKKYLTLYASLCEKLSKMKKMKK